MSPPTPRLPMAGPSTRSLVRRYLLPIHRWVGLSAGLLLAWMALTGAGMALQPQLAPRIDRALLVVDHCVEPLPLDVLADAARAAHPAGQANFLWLRPDSTASAMLRFTDNATVYLDPCSGAPLGQQHKYGGVFGRLEQLHRFKFIANGSLVTGTGVIVAVLGLLLGGLGLWWASRPPAGLPARAAATQRSPRARALRRHRSVGIWALVIVLASALTGLPKALDWYHAAVLALAGSTPEPPPPTSAAVDPQSSLISLQDAWTRVRAVVPEVQEARLYVPRKAGTAIEVELIERGAPHTQAYTRVYLDAHSGEVLQLRPYSRSSAGHKLLGWMLAWHRGLLGGAAGQLVLIGGMLAVLFLAWTGVSSDLRRRFARSASAARSRP